MWEGTSLMQTSLSGYSRLPPQISLILAEHKINWRKLGICTWPNWKCLKRTWQCILGMAPNLKVNLKILAKTAVINNAHWFSSFYILFIRWIMEVKDSNIKIQGTVQKQEMKCSAENLISFQVKSSMLNFITGSLFAWCSLTVSFIIT